MPVLQGTSKLSHYHSINLVNTCCEIHCNALLIVMTTSISQYQAINLWPAYVPATDQIFVATRLRAGLMAQGKA